ncbi:hypothetical protein SLOPH_1678 [Spraguea lophii 42_110]|uniref:Mechanosensitive ion channel MscS domain-containing protein n=1 Tax=Spraguea lophii (strain 42_110) TaxID=1358809 RepID=S7WC83_SPRLO|nr:hypothetical protein SLOPH_1678 [Spraguea lophii 42_110]
MLLILFLVIFIIELVLYFIHFIFIQNIIIISVVTVLALITSIGLRHVLLQYDIRFKTLARLFKNKVLFNAYFLVIFIIDRFYPTLFENLYKLEIGFAFLVFIVVDVTRAYLYENVRNSYFEKLVTGLYVDILRLEKYFKLFFKKLKPEEFFDLKDDIFVFYIENKIPEPYDAREIFEWWSTYRPIKVIEEEKRIKKEKEEEERKKKEKMEKDEAENKEEINEDGIENKGEKKEDKIENKEEINEDMVEGKEEEKNEEDDNTQTVEQDNKYLVYNKNEHLSEEDKISESVNDEITDIINQDDVDLNESSTEEKSMDDETKEAREKLLREYTQNLRSTFHTYIEGNKEIEKSSKINTTQKEDEKKLGNDDLLSNENLVDIKKDEKDIKKGNNNKQIRNETLIQENNKHKNSTELIKNDKNDNKEVLRRRHTTIINIPARKSETECFIQEKSETKNRLKSRMHLMPSDYDETSILDETNIYGKITDYQKPPSSENSLFVNSGVENTAKTNVNYQHFNKNLEFVGLGAKTQSLGSNIEESKKEYTPEEKFEDHEITEKSLKKALPFGKDDKYAKELFNLLSFKTHENLQYDDFKQNIRLVNNERRNLYKNIQDFKKMLELFRHTLLALEGGIVIAAINFMVGSNITLIATFTPFFVVFVLPFLKRIYDSFYFIVFSHPYDTGDRIYFHGENLVVKEIHIFYTICEKWNGEIVIINNSFMKKSMIKNVRRSPTQTRKIELLLNKFQKDKFKDFRNAIISFVNNNSHRYSKVVVSVDDLVNDNDMHVSIYIKHFTNWQSGYLMWNTHTKFMNKLLEILKDLEIKYLPIAKSYDLDYIRE